MEKLNIAELLRDCPKGMELDCVMFDNITLHEVRDYNCNYPILINSKVGLIKLTKYGQYFDNDDAKCVIFPKGKTTWDGFQRPFKDGDVIVSEKGDIHLLSTLDSSYCAFRERWVNKLDRTVTTGVHVVRFATEEEKQKLFDAIKANGYKWNAETKTLEKLIVPKFKVGDVIQDIDTYKVKIIEVNIEDECYGYESMIVKGIGSIDFSEQDNWVLVPNKFDITTLKPFESRVLVRDFNDDTWLPAIFGIVVPKTNDNDLPFVVVSGNFFGQCIPYESNEHLLGTTNACNEYYKTWE